MSSKSPIIAAYELTLKLHRDIKLTNIFIGEWFMARRCSESNAFSDAKGDCKGNHFLLSHAFTNKLSSWRFRTSNIELVRRGALTSTSRADCL